MPLDEAIVSWLLFVPPTPLVISVVQVEFEYQWYEYPEGIDSPPRLAVRVTFSPQRGVDDWEMVGVGIAVKTAVYVAASDTVKVYGLEVDTCEPPFSHLVNM